jgi:hypothetical protein
VTFNYQCRNEKEDESTLYDRWNISGGEFIE